MKLFNFAISYLSNKISLNERFLLLQVFLAASIKTFNYNFYC